jgi:hypothetical protein
LILEPDDFSSFPTCPIPLLLEAVTREWRFHVTDSVPVPLSGRDPQVCVLPPGCLPLPYLRCQDTPSVPTKAAAILLLTHSLPGPTALSFISVCLTLPVLTGPLASHGKLVPWYLTTFLSYSHT